MDHIADLVVVIEVTDHAHDRRDPAAGADEQELFRRRIRQHELPLDLAEGDDRSLPRFVDEVG